MERDDPIWIEKVLQWKETKSQIEWLEGNEKVLRNELIEMAQGSNCRGGGIKLSKVVSKGTIDYKSIPELIGIDLEKYRKKPTECWKITQDKGKS